MRIPTNGLGVQATISAGETIENTISPFDKGAYSVRLSIMTVFNADHAHEVQREASDQSGEYTMYDM
jgi:hypothetical protein